MSSLQIPSVRVRVLKDELPHRRAAYVLYWMIAARRLEHNFTLQHACWWARELDLPLLVFEPLRLNYRWASDRMHAFVLEGMAANALAARAAGVAYVPYVEPAPGAGKGLLARLAADAALVVTDDYPTYFLPAMVSAAARTIRCRLEAVDANGLVPMRATDTVFSSAHAFRRYLQKVLPLHLAHFPVASPLERLGARTAAIPDDLPARWAPASPEWLDAPRAAIRALPIAHDVLPSAVVHGGADAASARLTDFLARGLARYHEDRNHPDEDAASGLSPWLHFGHIGVHRIFTDVMTQAGWTSRRLTAKADGRREGWWGAPAPVEAFLDELVTWREIGINFAALRADHDRYESLPQWARVSLEAHESDERPHLYTLEQFEHAATHDEVWNAAQRQIVREGRLHNYLRMLWGKKILHWTRSAREALAVMTEINNKYGLDGRDPNSWSGIFWVLGRYDRPWAPRREVFGVVRYMSSDNTKRKLRMRKYLRTYGPEPPLDL